MWKVLGLIGLVIMTYFYFDMMFDLEYANKELRVAKELIKQNEITTLKQRWRLFR